MGLIKLEIALDYPINWEFCRIFRDLIQNFYDSLGADSFYENFNYSYEKKGKGFDVIMETQGTEFSYEWLTYVGGSTKSDRKDQYIGKYGEGFKMSALQIMQMKNVNLTMHSQNWLISPAIYKEKIDGRKIPMLGYDYKEVENDGCTRLEIKNIPIENEEILEEALLDFFYPQNVLLGTLIGRGEDWELYRRSNVSIPCRQKAPDLKGILYVNNLARGRLDIPIVINYKTDFIYDSRSRETLSTKMTIKFLNEISRKVDAATSFTLLEMLKNKWNEYPKDYNDISTKYYFVCQLVRNISKDKEWTVKFTEKYQNLAYIERKKNDAIRNRIIEETAIWARANNTKRLVNPIFRLVGAESLVEKYIEQKESVYVNPTVKEMKRMSIAYDAVVDIVPLKLTDEMPVLIINENEEEQVDALQFAERIYSKRSRQKARKYKINKLVFRHSDFGDDSFEDTLIKVTEALLHVYGTDRSSTLTALITCLGGWILNGAEKVHDYEKKWRRVV